MVYVTRLIMTFLVACIATFLSAQPPTKDDMTEQAIVRKEAETSHEKHVYKIVLENGLTVLVRPVKTVPKVSIQLWYYVGSKDEKTGERGLAHLIEHMIFKGTQGAHSLNLSESDINVLTHMLSGSCNAFTSYDYTGYLFNMPAHNWKMVLPIMADCMTNCSFKEDHLSSEMKAVIQELKMGRDNYQVSVIKDLLSIIMADHPYHYSVIGYKQDLWSVNTQNLRDFYSKHYAPNNATLVIVGDVNVDDVFATAQAVFGHIPAKEGYTKEQFYHEKDVASKAVSLYRDVQKPFVDLAWVVPGSAARSDHALEIFAWILGSGKGSRLYKKIVDEHKLATSLSCFPWNLFDHGIFFVAFEPINIADKDKIIALINEEIADIARNGLQRHELERAVKKARMEYYKTLEDTEQQAYEIGKYFLATGDEEYIFKAYMQEPSENLAQEIQKIAVDYFRPSVMHTGLLLPLPEEEKEAWQEILKESDIQDTQILSARVRTTPVEPESYANHVTIKDTPARTFAKAQHFTLSNGLKVLYYQNPAVPKIDIALDLRTKAYYDPQDKQGLTNFVSAMMTEGTENYTASELAQELESRGMSLGVYAGGASLSMMSSDFAKGLELLQEVLERATFPAEEIEKVRIQISADIKDLWDNPAAFSGQLVREYIYKDHPYAKNALGTQESVNAMTYDDLVSWYEKIISPSGARIAIVGDLSGYDIQELLEQTLGQWHGPDVQAMEFPELAPTRSTEIDYYINRDQVVLCFAGLSIDRKDPEYEKYVMFDQIFGGGALGSMSSRLFELREQSGLFYSIRGSAASQADEQPGMVLVKTLVSLDRLNEAEKAIKHTIDTVVDTLTEQDIVQARNAIINSQISYFESNKAMAGAFLFLERFGFSPEYFDKRAEQLATISVDDVKNAVRKAMNSADLAIFKIGRLNDKNVSKR